MEKQTKIEKLQKRYHRLDEQHRKISGLNFANGYTECRNAKLKELEDKIIDVEDQLFTEKVKELRQTGA